MSFDAAEGADLLNLAVYLVYSALRQEEICETVIEVNGGVYM